MCGTPPAAVGRVAVNVCEPPQPPAGGNRGCGASSRAAQPGQKEKARTTGVSAWHHRLRLGGAAARGPKRGASERSWATWAGLGAAAQPPSMINERTWTSAGTGAGFAEFSQSPHVAGQSSWTRASLQYFWSCQQVARTLFSFDRVGSLSRHTVGLTAPQTPHVLGQSLWTSAVNGPWSQKAAS